MRIRYLKTLTFLLLGLVLLAPVTAFAATAFPYFGPLKEHELHIEQGFFYAHSIRKMISTPSSALFYLALTAALVGFFLIVVKADNRKPATLFCWGILVLTLIISPISSPLLFTPITVDEVNITNPNIPKSSQSIQAFTPQAAAFHVVSNIHEILLVFFKSKGYTDMFANIAAQQKLMAANSLILGPDLLKRVKELANNDCRLPLTLSDLQDETANLEQYNAAAQTTASAPGTGYGVTTLGKAVEELNQYYDAETKTFAPPYIMLFSSEQELAHAGITTPAGITAYKMGIAALIYEVGGTQPTDVGTKTVTELVTELKATGFGDNSDAFPDTGLSHAVVYPFASSYDSTAEKFTIGGGKAIWHHPESAFISGYKSDDWHQKYKKAREENYLLNNDTYSLRGRDSSRLALANLPVGKAKASFTNNGNTPDVDLGVPMSCAADSNAISEDILKTLYDKANICADEPTLNKVKAYISGGENIPASALDVPRNQGRNCDHLQATVEVLNGLIADTSGYGNYSNDKKRAIFVDKLISSSVKATQTHLSNQQTEMNKLAQDANSPTAIRGIWNSGLGRMFAGLAFDITEGVLKIVVQVIGFVALLFVQFLTVLINVAMTGIIVVTPFVMLVGLVIPANAFGILVFVTASCFVLKMVPITYLILNAVFAILYNSLGQS